MYMCGLARRNHFHTTIDEEMALVPLGSDCITLVKIGNGATSFGMAQSMHTKHRLIPLMTDGPASYVDVTPRKIYFGTETEVVTEISDDYVTRQFGYSSCEKTIWRRFPGRFLGPGVHAPPYAFWLRIRRSSGEVEIFAGGVDSSGEMHVKKRDIISTMGKSSTGRLVQRVDGIASRCRVLIRKPMDNTWYDVTVRGQLFCGSKGGPDDEPIMQPSKETNKLVDGTMISTAGIIYLYRDTAAMHRTQEWCSEYSVAEWASHRCPIFYTPFSPEKLGLSALTYLVTLDGGGGIKLEKHVRWVAQAPGNEGCIIGTFRKDEELHNDVPCVFPMCGHVIGYIKKYVAQKIECPICRTEGPYVPVRLDPVDYLVTVDATTAPGPATHVFNPCGHCTSEANVKYWTATPQLRTRIPADRGTDYGGYIEVTDECAACPFCFVPLDRKQPYSKLFFN